ncbi:MAG: glutamate--tRNA ligase [Longimicrobiales bacterium]|nr:glutamate--tRNA ligase [Longimicrobiales bacterium]
MSVRVRFPPSPTGYLHVGGARTALFNWLLARRSGGVLVLRIEDTDRERSSDAHTRAILDGMAWLGLDWDEGPFFQSDGVERHRAQALRLLAEGKAYRDFSDPAALREEAAARGVGHPSVLAREKADALGAEEAEARAAAGVPHALRLRVADGTTSWNDLVHGEMTFRNEDLDDLVILRADGSPIYNLAVVSDDAEQRITHVIRGDDHLSNTPKQVLLYRALGLPVPVFGHVPMILGPDGKRLSKRHGATAVGDYAHAGILPDAMVNFLALLGWNPGDEREVMTRAELVAAFSMDRVQRKSAVFDTEKLAWLNGQYLARTPASELLPLLRRRLGEEDPPLLPPGTDLARSAPADWPAETRGPWEAALVDLLKPRARTVVEMARQAEPFLSAGVRDYEEEAVARHWARDPAAVRVRLERIESRLGAVAWDEAALEDAVRTLAEEEGVGAGKLIHPLRLALTGRASSPGIFEVLVLLGRARTLERLAAARKHLARAAP